MVFLKDFNKNVCDLLKDKFFVFHRQVHVKADQDNSVSFEAKQTLKKDVETEFKLKQKESGLGEMEVTFKSSDDVKLELKTKDLVKNCDLKAVIEENTVETSAVYSCCDNWSAQLKTKFTSDFDSCDVNVATTFAPADGLKVGLEGTVNSKGDVSQYDLGVQKCFGDALVSVQTKNQLQDVQAAVYFKEVDVLKTKQELGFGVCGNLQKQDVKFQLAGKFSPVDRASLRWKVGCDKNLHLAYQYALAKHVNVSFGLGYNLAEFKAVDKVGYKVEFTL